MIKSTKFLVLRFSLCILIFSSLIVNNSWGKPQNTNEFAITVIPLSNELFMYSGKGGNIAAYVGNDELILVDSQVQKSINKILSLLNNKTINKPTKYVINTHWHYDHTEGNEILVKNGFTILAHENVRERLNKQQFVDFLNRSFSPLPIIALPTTTYNKTVTLYFDHERIDIHHMPSAHTDGDSVIHFNKNNVIHTGDIFVNTRYPFIDKSSGGSIDGIIKAVEKIITIADNKTKIIPGHGPVAYREQLQDYLSMLKDIRQNVYEIIKAGATLNEIFQSNITLKYDYVYSDKFIDSKDFLEFVYNDLTKK